LLLVWIVIVETDGLEQGFNPGDDVLSERRIVSPRPRTTVRPSRATIAALAILLAFASTACRSDTTPPEQWEEVDMAEQPALFEMRNGHPALADLDKLHLGQPRDAAVEALGAYCEHPVRRDSGLFGGDAYFLGCRLEDGETLRYVRVGFWPKIDDRVATLEVKRPTVPPAAVRRAFLDVFEESPDQKLQLRRIQMTSDRYRMFADWDHDGLEGPVHLVVGFAPDVSLE